MNNRVAFIDFVRGLLTINPLERWSPQQAKLHPFITQQKFTGPFVPPMNLKSSSLNRSPAPGTQQQQQAEALSRQRAQAAQAQANSAAQGYASMAGTQYGPQPPMYPAANSGVYSAGGPHAGGPPPYPAQQMMGQAPAQMPPGNYGAAGSMGPPQQMTAQQQQQQQQQSLYQQATMRTGRQRASTMEQQQSGIPFAIQRVASHLDPTQPIRLQPSPAYYPPPPDIGGVGGSGSSNLADPAAARNAGRRGSRIQGQAPARNLIKNLEERTLEEGFMSGGGSSGWH